MIKTVFFDKNHCLIRIDTQTYVALPSVMKKILGMFNTDATTYQITQADKETFRELLQTFGPTSIKIYSYKLYLRYFLKRFFVRPTEQELERAYKILLEGRARNMRAEIGAKDALRTLKERELKLCVITDSYYERALYHLKRTGLLDLLDEVVTCDLVGTTKADPEMYKKAVDLTKSKNKESMMVTAFEEDVANASHAGLKTVLISKKEVETKADYQIRDVSDLPRIRALR